MVNILAFPRMPLELSTQLMLPFISPGKNYKQSTFKHSFKYNFSCHHSTDVTKDNLHFMTVIKFDGAEAGDCIQVGGGTERCNNLYSWPTEWTTGAVVGQIYTASINVSNAKYNWKPGYYTVQLSFILFFLIYLFIYFEDVFWR